MRPQTLVLGALVSAARIVGGCALLAGCNAVLGIDAANPAPDGGNAAGDSGPIETSYVLTCGNYCDLVQRACKPVNEVEDDTEYLGVDSTVCMQICMATFEATGQDLGPNPPEPSPADTLNCRVWHANAALVEGPHLHCPHAGPLGGNMCNPNGTDPCVPFCNMDLSFCTGESAAYASVDECLNACRPDAGYAGYAYEEAPLDASVTDLAIQYRASSNTLNCRMYHLENVILLAQPVTHCPHTSQAGGGVCTDGDD